MKLSTKIVIGVTATAAVVSATSIILENARRKRNKRMLHAVSNEGYETAGDILFPQREGPDKGLHYGPVLPK